MSKMSEVSKRRQHEAVEAFAVWLDARLRALLAEDAAMTYDAEDVARVHALHRRLDAIEAAVSALPGPPKKPGKATGTAR